MSGNDDCVGGCVCGGCRDENDGALSTGYEEQSVEPRTLERFVGVNPSIPMARMLAGNPLMADTAVRPDMQLMREFNTFWPSHESTPRDFAWLASVIDRKKAWRFVSQYSAWLNGVGGRDKVTIEAFIFQALSENDPTQEASSGCCTKKSKDAELKTEWRNVMCPCGSGRLTMGKFVNGILVEWYACSDHQGGTKNVPGGVPPIKDHIYP